MKSERKEGVKLERGIWRKISDSITGSHPHQPEVRLRVTNLTRQTEIAHSLEVADRGPNRRKGLLGREALMAGEGLWITPCEAVHTFGMRFSIDLVYLDRKLRVKKVRNNVPAWRLSACLSAHSVIELPSGTVSRTQTKAGDMLECSEAPAKDLLA